MQVSFLQLPGALWGGMGGLLLMAGLLGCQTYDTKVPKVVDFQQHIRPILENRCLECHNSVDAAENGRLILETRALALSTGNHAPVMVPGRGEESVLYRVLAVENTHPMFMPPVPDRLWKYQLGLVRKWIDQGVSWPEGKEGRLVRPQDWDKE